LSSSDYQLLVESVVDYAIFMLDVNGRVVTWNRGAEKIKGYAPAEIIGEHFSKFYTAEDIAAGKPEHELEVVKANGRVEDEGYRVRKDGSLFWASVVITALRDDTGELRGFGKVTRDLTARRAAELALHQSEQRFHHLVDSVIDYAIFILDPTGHVATWNAGARRLKGYELSEILGQYFAVFYTPEDRAVGRPERNLEEARRVGRVEDEGYRIRKDGSRFWANVIITTLRDEKGELVGFAKVTRDLTERRKGEEELALSEERFRLLIDNIGDHAVYLLDPDGHVSTWNRGAERLKGYAAAEIIGRHFSVFFPPEDVADGKPQRELERARAFGRFDDEGYRVRRDGTRFWASTILTALRDGDGTLLGFAKITRDLTAPRAAEQRERELVREQAARAAAERAEAQIRESEARYRSLSERLEIVFEGVADCILAQDASGRVVFANVAAARLFGFASREALMAATPEAVAARLDFFDEAGRALARDRFPGAVVLGGATANSAMLQVRERATGREQWLFVRAGRAVGEGAGGELTITIWHDVTAERRQDSQARCLAEATAALSASLDREEMLGALAGRLVPGLADWCAIALLEDDALRPVALAHADSEKRALVQRVARHWFAESSAEHGPWRVVHSGSSELVNALSEPLLPTMLDDPDALAALRELGASALMSTPVRVRGKVLGVMTLFTAQPGRSYDSRHAELVEEIGRRTGVALENAHLYAEAQRAARAAEEANRAKDEFLATVSHELRTPLSAILGWSRLLKDRVTDRAFAKPLEVIHRNAEAQVRIIDDILDVSRVITGKFQIDPKPMDLVVVARDALEVVRPSAVAKGIALDFKPDADYCLLVGDPDRLQQVVWNLLSNAVKFTPAGGSVVLTLGQRGSEVVLAVTDNGIGLESSSLPFVFDRFKQVDPSTTRRVGGLGLGLALVRHIMELHGGSADVESAGLGHGATFTIRLPLRASSGVRPTSAPPESVRPPPNVPGRLHNLRVLVVEDEPDARELISAVLEMAGAQVRTVASAREGYEALQSFRPDVLLSDIGMPDEDGFAFIRRVRALPASKGGAVPAMALSAFARDEDRARALATGFQEHVGKPVSPERLCEAVAEVAARA
jgi:PAS domain S-box-containing protein